MLTVETVVAAVQLRPARDDHLESAGEAAMRPLSGTRNASLSNVA